jgi:hypothetical protein
VSHRRLSRGQLSLPWSSLTAGRAADRDHARGPAGRSRLRRPRRRWDEAAAEHYLSLSGDRRPERSQRRHDQLGRPDRLRPRPDLHDIPRGHASRDRLRLGLPSHSDRRDARSEDQHRGSPDVVRLRAVVLALQSQRRGMRGRDPNPPARRTAPRLLRRSDHQPRSEQRRRDAGRWRIRLLADRDQHRRKHAGAVADLRSAAWRARPAGPRRLPSVRRRPADRLRCHRAIGGIRDGPIVGVPGPGAEPTGRGHKAAPHPAKAQRHKR